MSKKNNNNRNQTNIMNTADKDDIRQYLDYIESNITRMNQLSFQIKEIATAILTALLTAFVAIPGKDGTKNAFFLFIAIVPTLIFWMLDSYYLQQERKYRGLYEDVIDFKIEKMFCLSTKGYKAGKYNFFRVLWSKTEWTIYFVIIALLGLSGILFL